MVLLSLASTSDDDLVKRLALPSRLDSESFSAREYSARGTATPSCSVSYGDPASYRIYPQFVNVVELPWLAPCSVYAMVVVSSL